MLSSLRSLIANVTGGIQGVLIVKGKINPVTLPSQISPNLPNRQGAGIVRIKKGKSKKSVSFSPKMQLFEVKMDYDSVQARSGFQLSFDQYQRPLICLRLHKAEKILIKKETILQQGQHDPKTRRKLEADLKSHLTHFLKLEERLMKNQADKFANRSSIRKYQQYQAWQECTV